MIRIDDHIGIALAGLAPDARVLSNFMRQQAMSSKMVYNRPIPVSRVVNAIADKAQKNTQQYGRRPYGVGLLIIGFDEAGPHLFEFVSSGQVLEYSGTAIGARSQSSRTYLERTFEHFPSATSDELILHGLRALRDSLAQDKELTQLNTSIGIVGIDTKFRLIDGEDVSEWLLYVRPVQYFRRANICSKMGDTSMTAVRARESIARNAQSTQSEAQAAAAELGGDAMEE